MAFEGEIMSWYAFTFTFEFILVEYQHTTYVEVWDDYGGSPLDGYCSRSNLGHPEPAFGVENLPLQIRWFHRVLVHDPEGSY
jgi:hypothetical protein